MQVPFDQYWPVFRLWIWSLIKALLCTRNCFCVDLAGYLMVVWDVDTKNPFFEPPAWHGPTLFHHPGWSQLCPRRNGSHSARQFFWCILYHCLNCHYLGPTSCLGLLPNRPQMLSVQRRPWGCLLLFRFLTLPFKSLESGLDLFCPVL